MRTKASVAMRKLSYRFQWRENNHFTLLTDGRQFYPRMLEAVRTARSHVLLEMYLVESGSVVDQFIDAFAHAARSVVVCLLLDDYGARGLHHKDRARLLESGVRLVFYNPLRYGRLRQNFLRDHRKLLLVDGKVAYVGGMGITDEFRSPTNSENDWHDVVVEIEGENVSDWQQLFLENWSKWNKTPLSLNQYAGEYGGTQPGRVVIGQGVHRAEMQRSLINRLRRAELRVWISTAYFVPSWKLRRAIRHAAVKGIDVRLLLPGQYIDHPGVRHAGRRFYLRLLRSGVRIFEYQPRFIHSKVALCDNWVSIGSSNNDRWSLRWNLEANQEVSDPGFAEIVSTMFQDDFSVSKEWHLEQWYRRSWRKRMLEWFWGRIDRWLERHSRRR